MRFADAVSAVADEILVNISNYSPLVAIAACNEAAFNLAIRHNKHKLVAGKLRDIAAMLETEHGTY